MVTGSLTQGQATAKGCASVSHRAKNTLHLVTTPTHPAPAEPLWRKEDVPEEFHLVP